MLNKQEYEKLLDDLKLLSKACNVTAKENDQIKRDYALGLVSDLMTRLFNDLLEMKENNNAES